MNAEVNNDKVSGDTPLTNPEDDRLGYAPLAKHLAESISAMTPTESVTIAVFGPWGSGKTTLLNFVIHYLQDNFEKGELVHVPFNPWWFSTKEDLIGRFFDQLKAVLARNKHVSKEIRRKIALFGDVISETPIPYSSVGKALSKLISPREKDIVRIKKEVEHLLKNQGKKILVTIDDIDRLSLDEIRQVFQLVKAVADFPNLIYFVAFDKEVAIKALGATQGLHGQTYLEKIIQVPFELPIPDKVSLRRLLFENLDRILGQTPSDEFDSVYWTNIYFEGIDHFINTPRDIVRLSNTLAITYPSVKGEVNPVDFIAIETLKVFSPFAYDIIRKNPESFAGHVDTGLYGGTRHDTVRAFHDVWMKQMSENDREPVNRLLKRIFPKLESNYGPDWESEWRRKLRVCSPEKFPIYFRLSIPIGMTSNAEIRAILGLTSNSKSFASELIRLSNEKRADGSTRASELLERLQDYTENQIPEENIGPILNAFFDVGDSLLKPEDEGRGLFTFGNTVRMGRIIFQLLKRVDKTRRYQLLRDAFQAGSSFTMMEDMLVSFGQQHGKWTNNQAKPEDDRLLTKEHLEELERIALQKIRTAAENGELINSPQLPSVLYRWRTWGSEEEVSRWVQDAVGSDEGLIRFIEKFLHKSYSQTMGDVAVRTIYRLDPKYLEPFIDPSVVVQRARKILVKDNLSENQKRAIDQLIREYDIRAQGKDPEAVLRS